MVGVGEEYAEVGGVFGEEFADRGAVFWVLDVGLGGEGGGGWVGGVYIW